MFAMKKILDGIKDRLAIAGKKANKLEDVAREAIRNETKKTKTE